MVAPRDKWSNDIYCAYHIDVGHSTDKCYNLKKNIEWAIKNGYLQEYIERHNSQEDRPSSKESQPPRVINTIYGIKQGPFTKREKRKWINGDVPLVISLHIKTFIVRCILVDIGSSVNIIYQNTWTAMLLPTLQIQNQNLPFVGFIRNILYATV